ncbi:ParB/RepB/Spo0J family partition protein [Xylocopilactobacillus apicola]|uniref:Chromosome partitioning protein ParB n=1 Tax=Xylocopilactobacillus apicola TaxID=2932184 RepID=A0AAU9DDT8_9LACO|nr:ParB/RepB/Spo0J family partition protein [Xylocopilactobacillus apicola]BDR58997.1 chromosome partitioning protein ParB [Xylocopilactobacillus apicola]
MATKKNRGLGTGLDAFFSNDPLQDLNQSSEGIKEIELKEIRPNPYQPRQIFDQDKLKELADSIAQSGVFQPVIVKKGVNGYELIAGERRFRASKLAGKTLIPAIVRDYTDEQVLEITVLENLQREDLSPIEEGQAFVTLIKKLNLTQDEVAKKVGKSRPYITNYIRLLQLPDSVKGLVETRKLSNAQARALLKLQDPEAIERLAKKVVNEGLTVRQIEKYIDENQGVNKAAKKTAVEPTPFVRSTRSSLEDLLDTKVKIQQSMRGKGKIEIDFASEDDLARIIGLLNVEAD